jgi:hypothetical protein
MILYSLRPYVTQRLDDMSMCDNSTWLELHAIPITIIRTFYPLYVQRSWRFKKKEKGKKKEEKNRRVLKIKLIKSAKGVLK